MSAGWVVAFCALALLTVVIGLVLIATMRQVGVLHQRIRPTGAGRHEGPGPGMQLPMLPFSHVAGPAGAPLFESPVTVMSYVTPGCSACKGVPGAMAAFARNAPPQIHSVLAMDVPIAAAAAYAEEAGVRVPLYQCEGLSRLYDVPGSPYTMVLRLRDANTLEVMGAGVANTLEQLEDLIDQSVTRVDGVGELEASIAGADGQPAELAISVIEPSTKGESSPTIQEGDGHG